MRRKLGILGLLIGLGVVLIFWFIPIEKKPAEVPNNIDINETAFFIFYALWVLFSAIVKLTMVLKRKIVFVNYASLIIFISFVYIAAFLPPKNSGAEFHSLHNFFGLSMFFGWSLIDAIDLVMPRLLKKW